MFCRVWSRTCGTHEWKGNAQTSKPTFGLRRGKNAKSAMMVTKKINRVFVLFSKPSISTEFLTLMKKVAKTPLIVDVLNIQGVQRQLERLADLLGKIQKALGEYLERERASFPRFYFVGDEDLLEIIGNSKSIPKLQKHFKKMFAGVAAIVLNEEENVITGLSSKEGEEVQHKCYSGRHFDILVIARKVTFIEDYGTRLIPISKTNY